MIHLIVVAIVLPFAPDLTVQMMSPFFADSNVPRSTTETLSFSLTTVQVGPLYAAFPKSLPDQDRPVTKARTISRPPAANVHSLRLVDQGAILGLRECAQAGEVREPFTADGGIVKTGARSSPAPFKTRVSSRVWDGIVCNGRFIEGSCSQTSRNNRLRPNDTILSSRSRTVTETFPTRDARDARKIDALFVTDSGRRDNLL